MNESLTMMEDQKGTTVAERKAGRSLYDRAYDLLKEMILKGDLSPGFSALEKEMADRLGMSRTPVREALIRLENDGLIEVLPRRGFRVSQIHMEDIREIFQVLSVLEVAAGEILAEQSDEARNPAIENLDQAVDDMAAALSIDDLDGWAKADERFHSILLENCGNNRLARMAFTFWDQAHRVRLVTLRLRPKPEGSTNDHRKLVDAIRGGDGDAAREIHRQHRKRYMKMLMQLLEDYRLSLL